MSRDGKRAFDNDASTRIKAASGHKVRLCNVLSEDGKGSTDRPKTGKRKSRRSWSGSRPIRDRAHAALGGPVATAHPHERIGRLRAHCRGIANYNQIEVIADAKKEKAVDVRWNWKQKEWSMMALPGVNCLRISEVGSDVEALWRTYSRLTDLEAAFCCPKSELGLRSIHHSKAQRADGHWFITVIAYQAMQVIRSTLKGHGITASCARLRKAKGGQMRTTTTTFPQRDGRTLQVRKTTAPEGLQRDIHVALGVATKAGGRRKTTI